MSGLLSMRAPGAKFETIGTRIGGVIVDDSEEMQQRDFDSGELTYWQDGKKVTNAINPTTGVKNDPAMQIVVEVQTGQTDAGIEGDDGVRTFYIRGNMLRAVRDAKRRAGGGRDRVLRKGGHLTITFVREEPPARRGAKPAKAYTAEYVLPAKEGEPAASGFEDAPPF